MSFLATASTQAVTIAVPAAAAKVRALARSSGSLGRSFVCGNSSAMNSTMTRDSRIFVDALLG